MNDLDRWMATVADEADSLWSEDAARRVEARLAGEASPARVQRGRNLRQALGCLGAAALFGCLTGGVIEARAEGHQPPRWPAAALAASPSVLLMADGDR